MTIQELCNKAAAELPEGFRLSIEVERGFGGVSLLGPDDDWVKFDDEDIDIEQQMLNAIKKANELEL